MRRVRFLILGLFLVTTVCNSFVFAAGESDKGTPLTFDSEKFAPMFPFKIDKGAPNNITNIQTWGTAWPAAGKDGFMTTQAGHFVNAKGTQRFFGSNLCFAACFPNKAEAEQLAATLARFGINIIRLHHMDMRNIWGKNINRTKTEIDPEQLDRLDYLIAQLESRGIYVNINLHVSRQLDELDGFTESNKIEDFGKGLDNFEPRMIQLQKKYAKDLLTHVNPYTGKAYINDPGVAMIEINNENSMVASWSWGAFDELPEQYISVLRTYWNDWLQKKYKTDSALKKAWQERSEPLGEEILTECAFTGKSDLSEFRNNWFILGKENEQFSLALEKESKLNKNVLKITSKKTGENEWIPQFNRQRLTSKKGDLYTYTIKARSAEGGTFSTSYSQAHEPWQPCGFDEKVALTSEWKTYTYTFAAQDDDEAVRLSIDFFQPGKTYEFAELSLKSGGQIGIPENCSLDSKSIPVPKKKGGSKFMTTGTPLADWSAFMKEQEEKYWLDMYRYVKDELKATPPVTGTQLQYGFWYAQGKLDYCDIHAYWCHPNFPHKPWDQNDWLINNRALVNSISNPWSTLPTLGSVRVFGRPLTVSEYDHPYPNLYCAEGNLMAAAFGAFQDWSVLYQFAWSHGGYDPPANTNFFDFCGNQAKLAHAHAVYSLFTRGDVKQGPGKFVSLVPMGEAQEIDIMKDSLNGYHRDLAGLKLKKLLSLAVYSAIDLTDLSGKKPAVRARNITDWAELPNSLGAPEKNWIRNEFREILYNFEKDKGYCTVDTAGTKLFTGFIAGRDFSFNGLVLKPGETRLNWATVTLVRTAEPTQAEKSKKSGKLLPGRYLLTATGLVHNTGAKIVRIKENDVTTAGAYGGNNGSAPVLCEGIPAAIELKNFEPNKVHCFALDNKGERMKEIKPSAAKNGTLLKIGPEYKTVWYEVILD